MSKIVEPSTPLSTVERAHQLWTVHPNDLDRLGFTREAADTAKLAISNEDGTRSTLGSRAMFYLAHINAAIDQAVVPLPDTDNQMHMLRRFARSHRNGEPIRLTPEDSEKLSEAILQALTALDCLWETIHGRKLTSEEKGLG